MTLEVINPINYPEWDQQIAQIDGATIFHTAVWAKVLNGAYGYQPNYFCIVEKGQITNLIPIMGIDSVLTGKRGVSLPFSDQVEPLVKSQDLFTKLFDAITLFGSKNKWQSIIIRGGQKFFTKTTPFDNYISSSVDLSRLNNGLYKTLKSNTRRNIKKAKKSGLIAKISQTREGVDDFYRLNCLTRKYHGLPPQPSFFFNEIYRNVIARKYGFVCLVTLNELPIAGVVFFNFNKKAIYKYGASDRRFLHLRPNDLAMFHAIKWCEDHEIELVDLGRTDPDQHGLLNYKRNWNSSELKLNYYKFNVRSNTFQLNKPKIKQSYAMFAHLPIPLLKLVGRVLYKHIA